MADNRKRVKAIREVQAQVRLVLLDLWDPIGISDEPNAQDEYDAYVGPITRLVLSDGGDMPIVQMLFRIETERMGLGGQSQGRLLAVAHALMQLRSDLTL